ncbi:putative glycosyl transferase [Edwardsiella tarda]|nr:putative glycosyl transferase [Edwardsiella tarda]
MRDNYRFSVLMSLYDKEKPEYLNECLESISHQTLMPDEIVIVLDGPVNINLMAILDKWIKIIPIVIYKIERNVGLGNALNFGISKCKNEIIARMDTDDICMPNRFNIQIPLINAYPELSVLGSAIIEFSPDDKVFSGLKQMPLIHDNIVKYSKYRNPMNHMTVVFKKVQY